VALGSLTLICSPPVPPAPVLVVSQVPGTAVFESASKIRKNSCVESLLKLVDMSKGEPALQLVALPRMVDVVPLKKNAFVITPVAPVGPCGP
jgi:hypothetical protein